MNRWGKCRGHLAVLIVLVLALTAAAGGVQRASILVKVETTEPGDVGAGGDHRAR